MFKTISKLLKKLRSKSNYAYVSGTAIEPPTTSEPTSGFVDINPNLWQVQERGNINDETGGKVSPEMKDTRKEVKPVEVVQEILAETPEMDIKDLDKKIKIVQRRFNSLKKAKIHATDELNALRYLKARKKYIKFAHLLKWSITTETKLKELCSKYKLRFVGLSGYYRNIPMEAIDEMDIFVEAYEKIESKATPEFFLIIDDGGKEERKDPILLASSPFGKWYYVLGAWDKEVEIVDEIIYKGK